MKSYNDILSIKYYKAIADACCDITQYGIDYISIAFFSPVEKPVFLSNMPNWAILYNREGLWELDTINKPKTFYLSGETYLINELIDKNAKQQYLHELCNEFNIYEAFSILKPLGKFDLIIISHTRSPIIDPLKFYLSQKDNVVTFTGLFINRIKSVLQSECPFLKNDSLLWNTNLLSSLLRSEFKYNPLSNKEIETLFQAGLGLSANEMARELSVSIKSVNKSLERTRRKLNCTNTFQAVSKANLLGILDSYLPVNQIINTHMDSKLSLRESEAVYWTTQGYGAKEIARRMDIESKSVQKHLGSAQEKLGCKNKVELVFKAHLLGMLKRDILKNI